MRRIVVRGSQRLRLPLVLCPHADRAAATCDAPDTSPGAAEAAPRADLVSHSRRRRTMRNLSTSMATGFPRVRAVPCGFQPEVLRLGTHSQRHGNQRRAAPSCCSITPLGLYGGRMLLCHPNCSRSSWAGNAKAAQCLPNGVTQQHDRAARRNEPRSGTKTHDASRGNEVLWIPLERPTCTHT